MPYPVLYINGPAELGVVVRRRTDPVFPIVFRESLNGVPGDPVDITGFTLEAFVKAALSDEDVDALCIWGEGPETDYSSGRVDLTLTKAETEDANKTPDRAVWCLYWTDTSGRRELKAFGSFVAEY